MNQEREIPTSLREYLTQYRETIDHFRWFWRELVPAEAKKRSVLLLCLFVAAMLFAQSLPLVYGYVINGIVDAKLRFIVAALGAYAFLIILRQLTRLGLNLMREWFLNRNMRQIHDRSNELFMAKTLGQHLEEGSVLNHANLEKATNRAQTLFEMIIFDTVPMFLLLFGSLAFLLFISPVAGGIFVLALIVHSVYSVSINHRVVKGMVPIERGFRAEHRQLVERWQKIERVVTSGKTEQEVQRLSAWYGDVLDKDWTLWSWVNKINSIRDLVATSALVAVLVYGTWLTYRGVETIGFLTPLLVWAGQIAENMWYVSHAERRILEQTPYLARLREVLMLKPLFAHQTGRPVVATEPVAVKFENVGLHFPVGEKHKLAVLGGIDFTIHPGEKVALIGPSGAGKTTIMKLLLRFQDPTEGVIYVNGDRLSDLNVSSWMEHVGYIAQQAQVFDGTIRYNLTFGLSEERQKTISDEEIWDVMRRLQIDFGARLTDGLETRVGRDGMKLSGGQAQRLMIGAAVVKKPIFMVIDEATSSLDSSTERAVQEGLQTVLQGPVGALIVAHRLSTVRTVCDRFLVIRPIEEVAEGESQIEADARSFEELYQTSSTFRRLADDQHIVCT